MGNSEISISTPGGILHFSWFDYEWRTLYRLPGWNGYRCDNSSPELGDGKVYLVIETRPGDEPSAKHVQALHWLLSQSDAVSKAIINAVADFYPQQKQRMASYFDPKDLDLLYPDLLQPNDLRHLMSPSYVHIYEESKTGLPYLGFELECNWDVEHGLGVLLNGNRVVALGSDALNPTHIDTDGGAI